MRRPTEKRRFIKRLNETRMARSGRPLHSLFVERKLIPVRRSMSKSSWWALQRVYPSMKMVLKPTMIIAAPTKPKDTHGRMLSWLTETQGSELSAAPPERRRAKFVRWPVSPQKSPSFFPVLVRHRSSQTHLDLRSS